MDIAILCRDLKKTYDGKIHAVAGIDLEIKAGECLGLLGPNGAGKTTTIEILEGLLEPTSGEIEIFGYRWKTHARQLREWIGISLQETGLPEKLTVREIVDLYGSFYRNPRNSDEVIEEMSLAEKADSWAGKLSGGQKQRLVIATALVGNPRILFLDEPTSGLDPQSRRQLWEIIRRFQTRGGTVLITTHYMDEAERLCDQISVVDRGRIIASGSPSQLIERLCGSQLIEFVASNGMGEVVTDGWDHLPGVDDVKWANGSMLLSVREPHATIPALLTAAQKRGLRLDHLTTRQASLEDVFVQLTGRHLRED